MAAQDHEMARPTEPKTAYPSEELVGDPGHVAPQIQYSQQLQEKFGLTSMIGFSCTIMVTWEAILFICQYELTDGGPLGSIIGFIFCWIGYTLVALCLSELNSIYPTAGGQYRGYEESGVTFFVGLIGPVFAFMGADGATHMSEEARNPRTTIPWSLITSITLNGALGFGMLLALLYCQGDVMQNLESPTGFPFLEAFMQALRSLPWATAYTSILLVLLIFATVAVLAATSRATYAFARDNGLPFSNYLGHLHERSKLPIWALGSYFNAIVLLTWRKLNGTAPEPGPWTIGKTPSLIVNIMTLIYIVIVFIFFFFPLTVTDLTPSSFNWAVVLYFGVVGIGMALYLVRGKSYCEPMPFYRKH
ncbi:hypothetical protein KC343_g4589 [Hortaea werneckii]|nr:hypothetical protein KC352_g8575 [Hortaea werneckii]KAI7569615.1 hypothetical protein KC317_g3177 [Hortaea werneckii]KAI7622616.1 hypothetical protein KC346_g3122 [Hortaea werneckii]KAI7630504.1 hypothetical protein KC343_g4589 [Hortaea werneckii]KAI7677915.1 hypothetical protein KC319_g3639 [Hortaea werneckii]